VRARDLDLLIAMRSILAVLSTILFVKALAAQGVEQNREVGAWIAMARIIHNGNQPSGPGVYLGSGMIITAAHIVNPTAELSVNLGGANIPAKILKHGVFEEVDLSLLTIDQEQVPSRVTVSRMPICEAPPWPGDPVIVVDATSASRSHIASPQMLHFTIRTKFSTLISDVATTGNSGSGVFDPNHKCLLGIMSRKFTIDEGGKKRDVAKYFVPAHEIRAFIAAASKS